MSTNVANPYIGPRAFEEGEAAHFFGRERELEELVHLLLAHRLVLLHAPSGAGKSSLVRAALVPRLRMKQFEVHPIIRVGASARAHEADNRYVYSTLLSLDERRPPKQRVSVERLSRLSLGTYFQRAPRPYIGKRHANERNAQRGRALLNARLPRFGINREEVFIFDQFEEVLSADPTDRAAKELFFAQLGAALESPWRWALFVLREDYLGALQPYLPALSTRLDATYRLDLLDPAQARQAIQGPALRAGVEFTDAAAQLLCDDLRKTTVQRPDGQFEKVLGHVVEPVQLQVVCYRLWERTQAEGARTIDSADIETSGDVDAALAGYYDERVAVTAAATKVPERQIRDWIESRLITESGLRGQVLRQPGQAGELLSDETIQGLVRAHLLRAEERRGAVWYELAHDRLVAPIMASNVSWRAANLSPLQQQAVLWEAQRRPDELLLRGEVLARAEGGLDETILSDTEQQFLDASRAVRKRRRVLRWLMVAAILAALGAFIFGGYAIYQRGVAIEARNQAEQSASEARTAEALSEQSASEARTAEARADAEAQNARAAQSTAEDERGRADVQRQVALVRQLAAQAITELESQPQRSVLLAIEAVSRADVLPGMYLPEAASALHQVLATLEGTPLTGHSDGISDARFSPDGRWLATGSWDTTILLWSTEVLSTTTGPITQTQTLLPAPLVLRGHTARVSPLLFSPDSRLLASGDGDGVLRLWDMSVADLSRSTPPPSVAVPLGAEVSSLAFGTGSEALIAAGTDAGRVEVWGSLAQTPIQLLSDDRDCVANGLAQDCAITALAFSPDGRWLASGSLDRTIRLHRLDQPDQAPIVLGEHDDEVRVLAFQKDGPLLFAGDQQGILWAWDTAAVDPTQPVFRHRAHSSAIRAIAVSADGQWLATGGWDNIVRVWSALAREPTLLSELRGHPQAIVALAFTADGTELATTSEDKTVRLWDWDDPAAPPLVLYGHENYVHTVAPHPYGSWIVSASNNENAPRLWSTVFPGSEPVVIRDRAPVIDDLVLSPDQHWLIGTTMWRRKALIWEASPQGIRAPPVELDMLDGWVRMAAVSPGTPESRWLAVVVQQVAQEPVGETGVQIWDLRAEPPRRTTVITSDRGNFEVTAFAPDDELLATGGADGIVRLWEINDAGNAALMLELQGHSDDVRALAFSPDGRWLFSGGNDRTLRQWDLRADDPTSTGAVLAEHNAAVVALTLSPDSQWLASGSEDTDVRLWRLASGKVNGLPQILLGHEGAVVDLAFSPNSRLLATVGNDDRTILLWDLAAPALQPMSFRSHVPRVRTVTFDVTGNTLLTGGWDGAIRLWSLDLAAVRAAACGMVGRNLAEIEWRRFLGSEPRHRTCADLPPHPTMVATLLNRAREAARAGDIDAATEIISGELLPLQPGDVHAAQGWNIICWHGALSGNADALQSACDQAVALAPTNGGHRDSRGIMRALTGDLEGAIEDFMAFIAWAPEHGEGALVDQREAWVAELRRGENPFDASTIAALRGE